MVLFGSVYLLSGLIITKLTLPPKDGLSTAAKIISILQETMALFPATIQKVFASSVISVGPKVWAF